MSDLHYLLLSGLLLWLQLLVASLARAKAWTLPGMVVAFGNRDHLPEATPVAGRIDRGARNMLENFVLFAAVLLAAHVVGRASETTTRGAAIFFWSRIAYFGVYTAGVTYVRTALWAVGVAGIAMIAMAALG